MTVISELYKSLSPIGSQLRKEIIEERNLVITSQAKQQPTTL